MTRYLKKCRLAALAGLASFAVWAIPAAPAGATVAPVCTGTPPYQSCTNVTTIHMFVKVTIGHSTTGGPLIKVSITVTDPHLNVRLYKFKNGKYRYVRTVFDGNVQAGTDKLRIKPKSTGRYELKVKATVNNTSKTVKKFFRV